MKTTIIPLPAHWASPLINNDWSGADFRDRADIYTWLADNDGKQPVSCSDEGYVGRFNGIQTELLDYTFLT